MTAYNIQPLDSYRLGRYQLPIPCYLCEHDNLFDSATCRICSAPMSLGRCATGGKRPTAPQLLATLGPDGCGKTVYLGMLLDILSRQRERLGFTTCDASSVALQQEAMAALARGEFPEPTLTDPEHWRWAHCRLQRRSRRTPLDVFLVDIAGKSILREIDHPSTYPLVGGLLQKTTGVFLIIDTDRVESGDKDEEFFAMQMLNHLEHLREKASYGRLTPKRRRMGDLFTMPPLAIVLAKSDQVEHAFDNPTSFVRGHLPNLWQQCHELFPQHAVFATSVVGACATRKNQSGRHERIPLRVEPRRVIDPFRWLMGQVTIA